MFGELGIPVYVAWISIFLVALYWYSTRNHGYWKKKGVSYVPPLPFVGNMFHGFKKKTANISDVITKNMLSVVKGEDWKRIRSIVSPTFSTGKIKRVMSIFDECAHTLCNNFLKAAKEGKSINAKEYFGAFTMDVIASSAFSTKIDSHNDPNNQFVKAAGIAFGSGINWRFLMIVFAPTIANLFGVSIFNKQVTEFFRDITMQVIKQRKSTGETRNDFLQLLLEANEETDNDDTAEASEKDLDANYTREGSDEGLIKKTYRKKPLTHDELISQCVIFFLAGYDTTSTALSMASYLLAGHPEIQDRMISEIDQAIQECEGKLTYEAIQKMKYMDNVISETLRIYPPVTRTERQAVQDYTLGETGIKIPTGMTVGCPVYAIHMDPTYYPDPEKFNPDRFTEEERVSRPAYTYMPFGGGPRNCVAMRFALMEIKMCLARMLSMFKLKRSPEMKYPLDFVATPFVIQPRGILLELEIRKHAEEP